MGDSSGKGGWVRSRTPSGDTPPRPSPMTPRTPPPGGSERPTVVETMEDGELEEMMRGGGRSRSGSSDAPPRPSSDLAPPPRGRERSGNVVEQDLVKFKGVFGLVSKNRKKNSDIKAIKEKRAEGQQAKFGQMQTIAQSVKRSYFTPAEASTIDLGKLKAGKVFKSFHEALVTVSGKEGRTSVPGDRSERALADLEIKAKAYLKRYDEDLSDWEKKSPESLSKKRICETALTQVKHWRLAEQVDSAGPPPWDEEKNLRMQSTIAELAFEDNFLLTDNPEELIGRSDKQGANASFWIKSMAEEDQQTDPGRIKQQRKLFFKPKDGEGKFVGMKQGGSAPREMLGKQLGDKIGDMIGLDFDLPGCSLVSLKSDRFGNPSLNDKDTPPGTDLIGSIQEFVPGCSELGEEYVVNPDVLNTVPKDQVQKAAVYDLLTLNMDRHRGNFMLQRDPGDDQKPPKLVPIDQGLILPNKGMFDGRRGNMLAHHNCLLTMPGVDEKLPDELIERLDGLDPDEIEASLRNSVNTLDTVHPELDAPAMVDEDAILRARRSAEFLKVGAKELTVKELYNAIAVSAEDIFETAERDKAAGFQRAIARAKKNVAAEKVLESYGTDVRERIAKDLKALGWGLQYKNGTEWSVALAFDGPELLRVWKAKKENPAARKRLTDGLRALGDPEELTRRVSRMSLSDAIEAVENAAQSDLSRVARELNAPAPGTNETRRDVALFLESGGDAGVRGAGGNPEGMDFTQKIRAIAEKAYQDLGGDKVWSDICAWSDEYVDNTSYADLKPADVHGSRGVAVMKMWREYNRLGGDKAYAKMGAPASLMLDKRIDHMKLNASDAEQRRAVIDKMSPEALDEAGTANIVSHILPIIEKLEDTVLQGMYQDQLADITKLTSAREFTKAYEAILPLQKEVVACQNVDRLMAAFPEKIQRLREEATRSKLMRGVDEVRNLATLHQYAKAEAKATLLDYSIDGAIYEEGKLGG